MHRNALAIQVTSGAAGLRHPIPIGLIVDHEKGIDPDDGIDLVAVLIVRSMFEPIRSMLLSSSYQAARTHTPWVLPSSVYLGWPGIWSPSTTTIRLTAASVHRLWFLWLNYSFLTFAFRCRWSIAFAELFATSAIPPLKETRSQVIAPAVDYETSWIEGALDAGLDHIPDSDVVLVRTAAQDEPRRRKSDDRDHHRHDNGNEDVHLGEARQSFVKKMLTGYPAESLASTVHGVAGSMNRLLKNSL